MSVQSDIDEILGDAIGVFGNEQIKIYGEDGSYSGGALVTGGAGAFDGVPGGYYEQVNYVALVRKSDLGDFVPSPQNLVDARGKELRIAGDGVTDNREHYRLVLVARDAPQ